MTASSDFGTRMISREEAEEEGLAAITYPFDTTLLEDREDLASVLRSFRKSPARRAALVKVEPGGVELWALPVCPAGAEKFPFFAYRE